MKTIINIFSIIVGSIVFLGSSYVFSLIFGLLLQIPLILSILSWPVGPELYMSLTVNSVPAMLGMMVCSKTCPTSSKGYQWGTIIYLCTFSIIGMIVALWHFTTYGFSYTLFGLASVPIIYIFTLVHHIKKPSDALS